MRRRDLLVSLAAPVCSPAAAPARTILFTGRGHSGFLNPDRRLEVVHEDGRGLRVVPLPGGQESGWGAYGFFRDGRALLQSMALPPDWKTKTFDEYYPRSRTRLWA